MSGNCATGSAPSAITPAIEMTIEMTIASRGPVDEDGGDHVIRPSSAGRRWRKLRRDGHSRPDALLTLDHDPLARLHALVDDGKTRALSAETDAALLDFIVLADDKDVGAGLVDGDGGLRDHHDLVAALFFDDHANRLAAGENVVGIWEHRPDRLTVGSRIDLDVEKIDATLLAVERAVGQSDAGLHLPGHLGVCEPRASRAASRRKHLHRVILDDRRKHPAVRSDQIAG